MTSAPIYTPFEMTAMGTGHWVKYFEWMNQWKNQIRSLWKWKVLDDLWCQESLQVWEVKRTDHWITKYYTFIDAQVTPVVMKSYIDYTPLWISRLKNYKGNNHGCNYRKNVINKNDILLILLIFSSIRWIIIYMLRWLKNLHNYHYILSNIQLLVHSLEHPMRPGSHQTQHLHHVFMVIWILYMAFYITVNIIFCVIVLIQLLFFQWIRNKSFHTKHKISGKKIYVSTWMLISLIPTNISSKLFAKIHRMQLPIIARKSLYQLWAKATNVNLDEMRYPLERFVWMYLISFEQ